MLSDDNERQQYSADVIENTITIILQRRLILLFLENVAVGLGFLTLQDIHNIRTLSEDIQYICTRN